MPAVADAEFVGDVAFAQGDVGHGIAFIEEVVVAAVDEPADGFDVVFRQRLDQVDSIMAVEVGFEFSRRACRESGCPSVPYGLCIALE